MPQLPTITVVTPCDIFGSICGDRMTWVSSCVWTSIKPGASTRPSASTTFSAVQPFSSPIATIRPAFTATSR
jgi:hypothetical protein